MDDKCLGFRTETSCGTEFDCEYEYSGGISCEDCMFGPYGGTLDPRKDPYEEEE